MRRVTAADERRPLQMRRRCISAACQRLGRARVGLIVPFGGSDGFFHFCLRILEQYPEQAANLQLDSFKKLRCAVPAISVLFFYHEPIIHGVKSTIRTKTAGKSSSGPEYARANFQNLSEDKAILRGRDQTIGGIYRLFRKCSARLSC
jgi:hypothetical protein